MKNIITVSLLSLILFYANAQDLNQVIFDPKAEGEILYGYCDREGLTSGEFSSWFEPEYQSYQVDDSIIFTIDIDFLLSCNIIVVLGTWCSDSKREVPRFFKILDYLHFPENNLKIICIDRSKNAEGIEIEDLNIQLVPTFIFFHGDTEMGSIIESPDISLEADMAQIIGK